MENHVLLIPGDFYHKKDYLITGISGIFDKTDVIKILDNTADIDWNNLNKYSLIVMARSGKLNPKESDEIWLKQDYEESIYNFVSNGGSLLVLHNGLAGYKNNGLYHMLTKGHFTHHPDEHPEIVIKPVSNSHSIVQGISNFTIKDEQYFVKVDKDTEVIFKGKSRKFGESPVGWAHYFKKGKVFCFTPGHTAEVLAAKPIHQILINGAHWLLRKK